MENIWNLSLQQILEHTGRARPSITGAAVLCASAAMAVSLLQLSAEISRKKTNDLAAKKMLAGQVAQLKLLQKKLSIAANQDLEVFNRYRTLLRKKHANIERLNGALIQATKSPLEVCRIVREGLSNAEKIAGVCSKDVIGDLKSGCLLLQASFRSFLCLVEGNIALLPEQEIASYRSWKEREEKAGRILEKRISAFINSNYQPS